MSDYLGFVAILSGIQQDVLDPGHGQLFAQLLRRQHRPRADEYRPTRIGKAFGAIGNCPPFGLLIDEYPIGKVLYETSGYISDLRISPNGDRIAFMDHHVRWDNRGNVAAVDLAGNYTALSEENTGEEGLAWSSDGSEIWYTAK